MLLGGSETFQPSTTTETLTSQAIERGPQATEEKRSFRTASLQGLLSRLTLKEGREKRQTTLCAREALL